MESNQHEHSESSSIDRPTEATSGTANGHTNGIQKAEGFLGRDQFLTLIREHAAVIHEFSLPAPWSGVKYRVKELTTGEKDKLENSMLKGKGAGRTYSPDDLRTKYIIAASVNADGTQLFHDKDMTSVRNMPAVIGDAIYKKIQETSAIDEEDEEELVGK